MKMDVQQQSWVLRTFWDQVSEFLGYRQFRKLGQEAAGGRRQQRKEKKKQGERQGETSRQRETEEDTERLIQNKEPL